MELAHQPDGSARVALVASLFDADQDLAPVGPEGFGDGEIHQPFDIAARRVVGAQPTSVVRTQGVFQQGAEDGRLYLPPIVPGGEEQPVQFRRIEREDARIPEQIAVDVRHMDAEAGEEAAPVVGLVEPPRSQDALY